MKHIEIVKKKEEVIERGPKKPQKLKVIVLRKVRQGEEFVKKEEIPVSIGIPQYYKDLQLVEEERKKKEEECREKTLIYIVGGYDSELKTICDKIREDFDIAPLKPVDIVKSESSKDTQAGKIVKQLLSENKEVPTDLSIILIRQEMLKQDKQAYMISEILPKDYDIEAFDSKICSCKVCISLETSEEKLIEKYTKKAEEEGREENIEELKAEIAAVNETNADTIKFFTDKGKIAPIDANRPIEEVYAEVKEKISSFVPEITHEETPSE